MVGHEECLARVKEMVEYVIEQQPVAEWRHISGGYRQSLLVTDDGSWKSCIGERYSQEELTAFEHQLHDMLVCLFHIYIYYFEHVIHYFSVFV